ncbi:MAG TPA: MBL fold metallo-hydrolase [Acidimicrobiales bacterium]|nr:MBL fold metallo-hydrolase [Acidimicrobiales bacterium]
MRTRIDEVEDRIYRISTFVPEVAEPAGLTFNQFLLDAEEPLLFHTGMRCLFPAVSEAVAKVMPIHRLRWIAFGHVEADECGAMNDFLAAAPHAEVVSGVAACELSVKDMTLRPPRPITDGEVLDIGGRHLRRHVRQIDTPHVPHNQESQVMFEEETETLFCGDLFTHSGKGAPVTGDDLVERALDTEADLRFTSCLTAVTATLRSLAGLSPGTLAIMHGSCFRGDGAWALKTLADGYESRFTPEVGFATTTGALRG